MKHSRRTKTLSTAIAAAIWLILAAVVLNENVLACPAPHASPTPNGPSIGAHSYSAGCLFSSLRICKKLWPIGPNNRYKCFDESLTVCELESVAFKKYLEKRK